MKASMVKRVRLLFLVSLVVATSPVFVFGQTSERVVDWNPRTLPGNYVKGEGGWLVKSDIEAFALLGIKVEGRSITLGQPFAAGEDWLRGLSVRVKNVSGKPITSIRILFSLPEAPAGFSLEYGKELSTGINYGEQKPIMPDEEIELVRNERHYNRDREGIAKRSGMKDFSKALIGMTQVMFEDGTIWSGSKLRAINVDTN